MTPIDNQGETQSPKEATLEAVASQPADNVKNIKRIVEVETLHRKRYLRLYMALLMIPLALGIAALIFGRSASRVNKDDVAPIVTEQLKPVRESIEVMDTRTAGLSDQSSQISQLSEEQKKLKENVSSLSSSATQPDPALAQEVGSLLPAIRQANKGSSNLNARLAREEQQSGAFRAAQARLRADVDKIRLPPLPLPNSLVIDEIKDALSRLEKQLDTDKGKIHDMEIERDADRQQIKVLLDAMKGQPKGYPSQGLSYPVKESSEAAIYDLNLKIKLGEQKGGKINRMDISSMNGLLINGKQSLELSNLEMGEPTTFQDGEYFYVLTPIYIQRRKLGKDFIGMSIRREPLSSKPSYKPEQIEKPKPPARPVPDKP